VCVQRWVVQKQRFLVQTQLKEKVIDYSRIGIVSALCEPSMTAVLLHSNNQIWTCKYYGNWKRYKETVFEYGIRVK